MKRKDWLVFGTAGLVTGGPVGAVLSPLVYRWVGPNIVPWAVIGLLGAPVSWMPVVALLRGDEIEQFTAEREATQEAEAERAAQDLVLEQAAKRRGELEQWAENEGRAGCQVELKTLLNDPDSYREEWATPRKVIDYDTQAVELSWTFRAKNQMGGYARAMATCETTPGDEGLGGFGTPEVVISGIG